MASIGDSKFKIVLLGDSDVGKTSILLRYVDDTFSEKTSNPPLCERTKKVKINGREITLEIWDTAGQERYRSLETHYFREADAAILVYSVVEEESFRNLCDYWLNQILRYLPDDCNIPILLVGNKKDLWDSSDEHVSFSTVQEYADSYDLIHPLQCSAKTGDNIHRVFHVVTSEVYKKYMKSEPRSNKERNTVQNQDSQFCSCTRGQESETKDPVVVK